MKVVIQRGPPRRHCQLSIARSHDSWTNHVDIRMMPAMMAAIEGINDERRALLRKVNTSKEQLRHQLQEIIASTHQDGMLVDITKL